MTSRADPEKVKANPAARRKYDPEETKKNLLEVATEEFAATGLSGARVDAIAERTRTTKRMIYYYFGSKEGLYIAVLEKLYRDIRLVEHELHFEAEDPETAIRRMVAFTFDYHDAHPEFVRLVAIENIHRAEFMNRSGCMKDLNMTVIETIGKILDAGIAQGLFKPGVDALDVHMLISSFCYYRVSNRYTLRTIFGRDPMDAARHAQHKQMITDVVLCFIRK